MRQHAPVTSDWVLERFGARDPVSEPFFNENARSLASACAEMHRRFERGGRLLTFGRDAYATDAAHLSVEFVHPVIVGKRALPAIDLSAAFDRWVPAILRESDTTVGFGPPRGDSEVASVLRRSRERGAYAVALPGSTDDASFAVSSPTDDPHVHQEVMELLGHVMYESVHVFFEHGGIDGGDLGASAFLYPFLAQSGESTSQALIESVADSIRGKAADARALREQTARGNAECIAETISQIARRVAEGGQIIAFGNGGSATDATDFALDCVMPEDGSPPVPAISLAQEPAIVTAVANDVGTDVIFLRQLIAQSRPCDVAVAFSTSGGSKNVVAALEEARKRGLLTIALLGYDGGEVARRGLADLPIVVRSDYIPRIQEVQATIYHVIREGLARA